MLCFFYLEPYIFNPINYMADLIFEIFSEEIPARMQVPAAENLRKSFEEKLKAQNIFYRSCKTFVTPRRLVLFADGLSLTQEDSVAEKKGPRIDADKNAIDGFLRSTGLTLDQLTVKETPKGNFYFAIIRQKGRQTKEIIREVLTDIIINFTWPKSMRWGAYDIRWVRPVQNIACIFGNEVLDFSFGHIKANDKTFGHRFLSSGSITIKNFDEYEKDLKKNFVILDQNTRKKLIHEEVSKLSASKGLNLIEDEGLLNEVTGLVEWPCVMLGDIDKDFMHLPEEVLITTVRTHQKYFCLRDRSGKLASTFIFVANINPAAGAEKIVEGNQRVVRARLFDAKFFFKTDNEKGLESFLPKLSDMIFHAKIGSVSERVERIVELTEDIIKKISADKKAEALRAAKLCKADLSSGMVGEFPELQGIMGYYYANEAGEKKIMAEAIRDHYKPVGANDNVPQGAVSISVSLADKIDAMVSLFAAGERATGSKDPYALRRLALGIIRTILENNVIIELKPLLKRALKLLPSSVSKNSDKESLIEEITEFLSDRIKYQLKAENYPQEVINCILNRPDEIDILALKNKVIILSQYLQSTQGVASVDAFKRALNILQIEEKKDGVEYSPKPSSSLLAEGPEKALYKTLDEVMDGLRTSQKDDDFKTSLLILTKLPNYINNFYDNTMINTEDKKIRDNRLKLSASVVATYLNVADFDRL